MACPFYWCLIPLTLILTLPLACATASQNDAPPTGEPLRVVVDERSHRQVSREKRGEVHHIDARGVALGADTVEDEVVRTTRRQVWSLRQGDRAVDELDFYRIAGDQEAATAIEEARQIGLTAHYGGLAATAVGGAMLATGIALPTLLGEEAPRAVTWASLGGLATGGSAIAVAGALLALYGHDEVETAHHLPLSRAQEAAKHYNRADQRLDARAGTSAAALTR